MAIRSFQQFAPELGAKAYVDESAVVIGDVVLGADASVWPLTVIRGDVNHIRIGSGTNVQDGSVLHVTHPYTEKPDGYSLQIGANVTVGHKVILHGCSIGDNCLIGMGATIMDGAVVEPYVLVGAGSLVSPGKELESGYLYLGTPVKKVRLLTESERNWIDYSAKHYIDLKNKYL
ncbi:MAG: gamma carbonic anhydrase family protein [Gammaproteobacteria bacterium]|nr:gamma carbonic anhydrase family protein [Gammaproteobacteria bacterium]MDH5800297.1 gamma carbonic anhydrase family protein [Gammaproteobacteria bacterium]